MNIQELKQHASELYKNMDWMTPDNGNKRVVIIPRIGDIHDELLQLTFTVSQELNISTDSAYRFTMEALAMIADSTAETEEDLRDLYTEIEPDMYTSDLTEWLNESNNHIYYLDQALENAPKDGFALLVMAQQEAMIDVFNIVIENLIKNHEISLKHDVTKISDRSKS